MLEFFDGIEKKCWYLFVVGLAILSAKLFFTGTFEQYYKSLEVLTYILIFVLLISPIAGGFDKKYKTNEKEILKKLKKPPSIVEFLALIGANLLFALAYVWSTEYTLPFFKASAIVSLGVLAIVWSYRSFYNKNFKPDQALDENELIYSIKLDSPIIKATAAIFSFIITAATYGKLNDVYHVDPSNFPLTLVFVLGFSVFIITSFFVIASSLNSFVRVPGTGSFRWGAFNVFAKEEEGTDAKIRTYITLLFLSSTFYFGSFLLIYFSDMNGNFDILIRNLAYNLDFNSSHPCKESSGGNKYIFLGPNHQLILEVTSQYDAQPSFLLCKPESGIMKLTSLTE